MRLTLVRTWFLPHCVIGALAVDGDAECFALEDKDREIPNEPVQSWKVPGCTAIPRGVYQVVITRSKRFAYDTPLLLGVPGFDGIRIHKGNTAQDTEGCILVGRHKEGETISESRAAYDDLFKLIREAIDAGEKVEIEIT